MNSWTLFSNHGHVLFCLARNPEARLRDVAADVGITERAGQKIVRDLQDSGMVNVTKIGRRNSYRIDSKTSLRHELEAACTLKDLIKVVNKGAVPARLQADKVKVVEGLPSGRYEPPETPVKPVPAAVPEKRSAQAASVKIALQQPAPVKAVKENPKKSDGKSDSKSDNKERQQGSLF